jgi:hypothetical protein
MAPIYSQFLRSSELSVWLACLEQYQAEAKLRALSPGDLAEALCVAHYSRWLAYLSADDAAESHAASVFERLAPTAPMTTEASPFCDAVLAACRGYSETARTMLQAARLPIPLEVSVLIMAAAPAKRALELRPRVYGETPARCFLPAVYFYAHALLDLGHLQELRTLLHELAMGTTLVGKDATASVECHDDCPCAKLGPNPLLIDLRGKLFELSGAWGRAHSVYRASTWAVHHYRASICSVIERAAAGTRAGRDAPEADELVKRGMWFGAGESDQAEAVRNASFVNACRWYDFDDWLVHYELGSLGFSRRRHAEAEKHLRAAAEQAPEDFRFAVNHLRFMNLTWLTGNSSPTDSRRGRVRRLPLRPETLECADAALRAPGAETLKAPIRTWLAGATGDLALLAAMSSDDAYESGKAHQLRGRMPDALRCWIAAISNGYVPRAFAELITAFSRLGFVETASYLVAIARGESWDNFFQLWELGDLVRQVRHAHAGAQSSAGGLESQFSEIEARLEQLAEPEFQHLIRAWQFYTSYDRADLAARALERATRLAETAEERLLVAMARQDPVGLEQLLVAERESTHRLERLEIAKELVRYGQIARARRLLRAEQVFEPNAALEPVEQVIALQCGSPCLSDAELSALRTQAETDLEQDLHAGLFAKYGNEYVKRLRDNTPDKSSNLRAWLVERATSSQQDDSVWTSWKARFDRLKAASYLEYRAEAVGADPPTSGRDDDWLFFELAAWGEVFQTLEALLDDIKNTSPTREPGETPISRSDSIAPGARATRVRRLWHDYLSTQDPRRTEQRLDAIKDFYREEQRLEREWEVLRANDVRELLAKARYWMELGRGMLEQITRHAERVPAGPPFLAVREHVLRDAALLCERLSNQTALTRSLSA